MWVGRTFPLTKGAEASFDCTVLWKRDLGRLDWTLSLVLSCVGGHISPSFYDITRKSPPSSLPLIVLLLPIDIFHGKRDMLFACSLFFFLRHPSFHRNNRNILIPHIKDICMIGLFGWNFFQDQTNPFFLLKGVT